MNQVKLVIWDLDETFWQGTLSEGSVTYNHRNHDIVIELTRRGIINSISSKNTFDDAKQVLEQYGIWDYFVFPKIDWQPKGQLIAASIEEMQLRAENVLFIDDNPLNLEEAKYYSPKLQTAGPEILKELLCLEACKGKDDSSLSRLKQYKLLEQKTIDQKTACCSNEEFLRSSNICVEIVHDCGPEAERILELINRTNQLNYTKHRVQAEQLQALINDRNIHKGYLRVRDKYGDYGVCGFYAKQDSRLVHFLFSCRILNMGVENWLYHKLGHPALEIAGEVATPLMRDTMPDWIQETGQRPQPQSDNGSEPARRSLGIIIKGGCDLLQAQNYLVHGDLFDAEVDYVSDGGYRINNSHSEILKRCSQSTLKNYGAIIDRIHFFDRSAFRTNFFSNNYNVYIYSVLDDYTRGLYRYRNSDFIIPFGDYTADLTDASTWDYHSHRSSKHKLDREFLEWFRDNFKFLGPIDTDIFKQNIAWICSSIFREKLLIILNGSEVRLNRSPQPDRWKQHAAMNRVLFDTVKGMEHVVVCDVREFAQNPEDHSHNMRHYARQVYYRIAQRINQIIEQRYDVPVNFWEKKKNILKYFFNMSGQARRKPSGQGRNQNERVPYKL